ncbi:MAG: ribonuclease E/G [Chlamydiales bacterium]|nr:ribonuclease E/G [Chlamydiia bacterium]MCP5507038.1 ribonuclease E/G [Chlamydiales bacterium]
MDEEILLNIESKEIRYAHLRNGQLRDLMIERKKERQLTGNIYRGKVTNILHNIQSAFIDINEGENGFIHISDILENTKKLEEMYGMDFEMEPEEVRKQEDQAKVNIEQLLKPDQPVLVQVVKEPIGSKGARLTSNISVAGRYLVLLPNSSHRGVSRKIEDRNVRDRLKKLIRAFEMPQKMGLICRTASATATKEQLIEEANELFASWNSIKEKFQESSDPTILYEESDIIKRAVITAIDKGYDRVLIDDYSVYQACRRIHSRYSNDNNVRIEYYRDKVPMFERFNVEREIDKTLRRKIWLPSGGYLFFDKTEAMHTVDVNSGRSQTNSGTDVEESLVRINLEAAEEIARQLRLRNIGGLIICDFIDMRMRKNQRRILDKLKECMKEDTAKCTILGMSEFGLVEMTRQRSKGTLVQTICTSCPYCNGSGMVKSHESVSIEIERALKKAIHINQQFAISCRVHPELDHYLNVIDKSYLVKLADESNARLVFEPDDTLHLNEYRFYSTTNDQVIEV